MTLYALGTDAPVRGEGAWVAPDAAVVGAVAIGARASIWFGAVVRGDNGTIRIGDGTNIQDGAVLHADPDAPLSVGADCTVGHRAILHGCTVGDGVLVGMGAIVLNHAVLGDGCIVGAGALVTERTRVAPGMLVLGTPARAVRPATPAERERMRAAAPGYADRAAHYRDALRPVG